MIEIKAVSFTTDMKIVWFSAGYRFQVCIYPLQPREISIESVRSDLITSLKCDISDQAWYWMLGELCACLDVIEEEELSPESWHTCL